MPNFIWSLLGKGEQKFIYVNGLGHMTKIAAMPIYGKTFNNLLLQNQKSYDLDTWHASSVTQAVEGLYK